MSPRKDSRVPVANSWINGEVGTWRTIPNALTALRVLLIFPFAYCVTLGRDLTALGVFAAAGISDALDGMLARRLNQVSKLGRLVDPVADKFLTGVAYVLLCLFRDGRPAIPIWLMAMVVSRDVLILAGCWIVYRVAHETRFKPTVYGKLNTLIELAVIACFLASSRNPILGSVLPGLYAITAFSILLSFVDYARQGWRMILK